MAEMNYRVDLNIYYDYGNMHNDHNAIMYVGEKICYVPNCIVITCDNNIKCSICEIKTCHEHISFCKFCKFKICSKCTNQYDNKTCCILCDLIIKRNYYLKYFKENVNITFCSICQKLKQEEMQLIDYIENKELNYYESRTKKQCCASCNNNLECRGPGFKNSEFKNSEYITKKDIKNFTSKYILYYTNETKPIYTKIYLNIFPKDLVNLILMYFRHFRE
jgi:hypothetical protein